MCSGIECSPFPAFLNSLLNIFWAIGWTQNSTNPVSIRRQPNHVLANEIAGHKAERRPRAGEEWLAATKYDGVEVKSILINKTKVGQASCQVWSGNFNLPNWLLQGIFERRYSDTSPRKPAVRRHDCSPSGCRA